MKIKFEIKDDGTLPVVYIDDRRLVIVSLIYTWHTKTDDVSDSTNICIVDGYLGGTTIIRRFICDIINEYVQEIFLEGDDKNAH